MTNIYDYTHKMLTEYLLSIGEKKYRANQIFEWLYKKRVKNFEEMTNLSDNLINKLKEDFYFSKLELILKQESIDKTVKCLYKLEDGNLIEAVVMSHNYGYSICITSQVGCNMGCRFCASGLLKKQRNLTAGEMLSQVITTEENFGKRISHIVVMGIGEPFDNYENLMRFLDNANNHKGLEIGARHITVSTCGLANKIKEYADEKLQINLAISLHASNNEIRNEIMPINKKYPIEAIIEAIKYYMTKTNRRITIEYIMIKDLNDKVIHAKELAELLKGLNVYVNLIPYNEVLEAPYKRSSKENMSLFLKTLKENGINSTLRKEQGHDIDAACGQLRSQKMKGK
ncbi:MAG: 23S rRNA (adenine(2503)-C(2))-methyltransferase RlmN [Acholeplasmataceae bacterium]|nr:23S rRNA (adenine(2503)-C(2))-methyltransferase RlmN [Acholeplasmataceae bacterium]